MCRNIKTLFNFEPPATELEIRDASLQFVRKLSGFAVPSQANEAAFDAAVQEIAASAHRLMASLVTPAEPKKRDIKTAQRARSAERFGPAQSGRRQSGAGVGPLAPDLMGAPQSAPKAAGPLRWPTKRAAPACRACATSAGQSCVENTNNSTSPGGRVRCNSTPWAQTHLTRPDKPLPRRRHPADQPHQIADSAV